MNDLESFLKAIYEKPDDVTIRLVFADYLQEHNHESLAMKIRGVPVVKSFGTDFQSPGGALTLGQSDVTDVKGLENGYHTRTHEDGWTIAGHIREDYYVWVNDFVAFHPVHGLVWGDFEEKVFATSEEGFTDFYTTYPPSAWDYHDI